jgi:hypothetical protein
MPDLENAGKEPTEARNRAESTSDPEALAEIERLNGELEKSDGNLLSLAPALNRSLVSFQATNHAERWFGTLRQRLGHFVRKTLSFSKCERMHEVVLRLFIHHYNQQLII